ncbi:hypothetical protein [Syntrophomonas curvata]
MDKYYLFSNVISVDRNHKLFPKALNINNSHDIYSFINDGIEKSCTLQSHEVFDDFVYSINLLVDALRGNEYYNAIKIYYHFYMTLTTIDYNFEKFDFDASVLEFIKSHDFTSIYYNYAVLIGENGDVNNYLHYLSLADNEYAIKNNCREGTFILNLIQSKNLASWNIVPYIISDYNNYKVANRHFSQLEKTLEAFNINLSNESFNDLICDFEFDVILQFIHVLKHFRSISTSFNFRESYNENGRYRNIRTTRFIGELTWLFEIYLKDKLKSKFPEEEFGNPLDKTIQTFLNKIDSEYEKKFKKIQGELFDKFKTNAAVNTKGLMELLEKINSKNEGTFDNFILYLLALKIFRNYYSHYMDRLGVGYLQNRVLRLLIFNAFLITKQLFDNDLRFDISSAYRKVEPLVPATGVI